MVSRDVFDELTSWNWNDKIDQTPKVIEDEETSGDLKTSRASPSPRSPSPGPSPSPSSSSSLDTSSSTPTRKARSLDGIYEYCDVVFLCYEPKKKIEDIIKERIWKDVMDEEIKATEKN